MLSDENKQLRGHFEAGRDALADLTVSELIREDELGPYAFTEVEDILHDIIEFHTDLLDIPTSSVPTQALKQFNQRMADVWTVIEEMMDFDPQDVEGQPRGAQEAIINELEKAWNREFTQLAPLAAYLIPQGAGLDKMLKQARDELQSFRDRRDEHLNEMEKYRNDIESIRDSVRDAAGEVGVERHATHFEDAAKSHSEEANNWLTRTTVAAIATAGTALLVVILYLAGAFENLSTGQMVQAAIGKIVFFSVLYYAVVWCARNYRSHQHNYVVNKHRQHALNTFRAIVDATDDKAVKDGVLLRATGAIFSPGASGYVPDQNESAQSPRVMEILRSTIQQGTNGT